MTARRGGWVLAARIAKRELRTGTAGFRILIACLALGVGAISGVGTLSQSLLGGIHDNAQVLLGGDVDIATRYALPSSAQTAWIDRRARARATTVRMRAMAQTESRRTLVELKAVDHAYPMAGVLVLAPAMTATDALGPKHGVYGAAVDAGLLTRLGVQIGDKITIGDATFQIRATITNEPDRIASVFSLGPRVMISERALPETALIQPGSQVTYHTRVLLPPRTDATAWAAALKAAFPSAGWRVHGPDDAAPGVQRFLQRMTLFLNFVGLTALLVGGIGVLSGTQSYLESKVATIATLKSIGAPSTLIFRIYVVQIGVLAGIGVLIGLILGAGAPPLVIELFRGALPTAPRIGLYGGPLATGAAFGALTALTFALWPLARAREIPPASLFRDVIVPTSVRPKGIFLGLIALCALALGGLVVLTSPEPHFAYWFVAVSAAVFAILRLCAWAVMAAATRIGASPGVNAALPTMARMAIANIYRPGAPTTRVVLSLGLGLSVLVAVVLIQGNIAHQIGTRLPDEAPAFFFIDIQPDQIAAFDKTVLSIPGAHDLQQVPTLRGRIVKINGVAVEKARVSPDVLWAVQGDRALTYAAQPAPGTKITAGQWWSPDYKGPPLISLDSAIARGFGIGVGDTLTLNILGRDVRARIAALREIDWRTLRFDFAIIFAPGVLENAPQTYIAALKIPPSGETAVERAVGDAFTNISTIRVREALQAADKILSSIASAVRAVAAITLLSGILVLGGTIAAHHQRRVYDGVIFKVLGATRRQLLGAFVLEFGVLGVVTGVIAAVVGGAAAWAVIRFLMHGDWVFLPQGVLGAVIASIAITIGAGFAATWSALGEKAAPYLRNE